MLDIANLDKPLDGRSREIRLAECQAAIIGIQA
jgi:hypothetical protein